MAKNIDDKIRTISLDTLKSLGKNAKILKAAGYGIVKGRGLFAVKDLIDGALGSKKKYKGGMIKKYKQGGRVKK